MSSPNQVWYLMARSLNSESTAEEEKELMQLLQNNFSLQQQYDLLQRLWRKPEGEINGAESIYNNADKNITRILQLANAYTSPVTKPSALFTGRRRSRVLYFAGGIAMIMGGIFFFARQSESVKRPAAVAGTQILAAQNGSRSKTILPDGSTVWLNAGSKIYYDKVFSGKLREVKLEGEAFFDVQKNPQKPFIVHTAGIDIKVLGTAFNVKSYPADKNVETTLLRGLVQVTRDNDAAQKPIFLHPNEKIIISKNNLPATGNASEKIAVNNRYVPIAFTITHLDSAVNKDEPIETAWINNRLIFRGDSFEEMAAKLERWYNISVIFEDEKAKRLNFTGSFENETVDQAFAALKTAASFNYIIRDNRVYINSTY